ncbi:MAG: hypothetical protein WCW65_03180 [Candidatus Paceibacterota bacterium]
MSHVLSGRSDERDLKYSLTCDGYGGKEKYGNGSVFVLHAELEKGEKKIEKECEFTKEVEYRKRTIGLNKYNDEPGNKWQYLIIHLNGTREAFTTFYETDGDAIEAAIEEINNLEEPTALANTGIADKEYEEENTNNAIKIAAIKALRGEIYDLQEERKAMRGDASAINTIDANILCLADRIVAIANGEKNG